MQREKYKERNKDTKREKYKERNTKREADRELRNVSGVMNGLPLNKEISQTKNVWL